MCDIRGITQSQHCSNENDDNMMIASLWFEFFGGLFQCQNPRYMRGRCDNKKEDLNRAHPFPRIWGYKKGNDITEVRCMFNSVIRCMPMLHNDPQVDQSVHK